MKAFLSGFLMGAMVLYIAFQSHVVCTDDGYIFVPKQPAIPLSDTYVDIRGWKTEDWNAHPRLMQALREADKQDVISSGVQEKADQEQEDQPPLRRIQAQASGNTGNQTQSDVRTSSNPRGLLEPIAASVDDRVSQTRQRIEKPVAELGRELDSLQDKFMKDIDEAYWGARRTPAQAGERVTPEAEGSPAGFFEQNPEAADPFRDGGSRFFSGSGR